MTRRRRHSEEPELDNWRGPLELVLVDEAPAAAELEVRTHPAGRPLPPRVPMPLSTLELAWSLEDDWIEPYLVMAIEQAGGFRPMLERAGPSP